jgi:prepilin-type N-terminal cleavage/methylation domain-containing protein
MSIPTATMSVRREQGFSLIEVLIAAAVMAVGLMALAALQASIARNAADARARSQVAAFADLVIERQRSAASGGFNMVPATDRWTAAELAAVQASAGISDLTVTLASTHFEGRTGNFVACNAACGAALPDSAPQYKQIRVEATWRDVSGEARRFNVTSVLSPRTVGDSRLPYNSATSGNNGSGKRPVVRTDTPVQTGVIPIAIGDNTDTAATNPRPEIAGKKNNESVVGTSYEVLTYRNEDASTVQTQRRVENKVIACTCNTSAAPTGAFSSTAQWPAFWNGERYVVYEPDSGDAPAGASKTAGPKSGAVQDELCTDCCRDHHDKDGGTDVRFDPFRSDHKHYRLSGTSLVEATSGDYLEACRMIRVDGFWRTAADLDAKHLGLIATTNNATSPVPTGEAVGFYESFVIDLLKANYIPGATAADAETLFDSKGLNNPAELTIARPPTLDTRYMHARGLYVDFLEQVAKDRIQKAFDTCPTGKQKADCVLPLLPFTSINTTELAAWSATEPSALSVSTGSSLVFNPALPTRGRVNALAAAATNATGAARAELRPSNSGVAIAASGVDPADDADLSDQQQFRVQGSAGNGSTGKFSLTLSGLPQTADANTSNDPAVAWTAQGLGDNCPATLDKKDTDPNPYVCNVFVNMPVNTTVRVQSYNRVDESRTTTVTCTVAGNTATGSWPARYCQNYAVSSATLGGVVEADVGVFAEDLSIVDGAADAAGHAADASTGTITFTFQGETQVTSNTCTVTYSNRDKKYVLSSVTWANCP